MRSADQREETDFWPEDDGDFGLSAEEQMVVAAILSRGEEPGDAAFFEKVKHAPASVFLGMTQVLLEEFPKARSLFPSSQSEFLGWLEGIAVEEGILDQGETLVADDFVRAAPVALETGDYDQRLVARDAEDIMRKEISGQ